MTEMGPPLTKTQVTVQQTSNSEPRKVKAVSNVSRVSRKDPRIVLENVHQVIQKMGIPNRVRGWIIRCQTRNNRGEVSMVANI